MSAIERKRRAPARWAREVGAATVEFAVIVVLFLGLLFAFMELARLIYLMNTVHEITRRAVHAAVRADPGDSDAMAQVRAYAFFDSTQGVPLGAPLTAAHLKIDYLSVSRDQDSGELSMHPIPAGLVPACAARARLNCLADMHGPNCIRLVRARICTPDSSGNECTPVPYQAMTGFGLGALTLPTAVTMRSAQSLGFAPGATVCQ